MTEHAVLRLTAAEAATLQPIGQPAPVLPFEADVQAELQRLRVRAEAKLRYAALQDPHRERRLDAALLNDVLARPDDEKWRIDRLLPSGGRLLVSAKRKSGKTTFAVNLARSLLTGQPFLGKFATAPVAGVAFLNFEVTARQCARWLHEGGVPGDRLLLVTLRGSQNPLHDDQARDELVALIRSHGAQVLIVDPFGRAFTGENQNDAGEVQSFLLALDDLAERAGCTEIILTAHTGHDGERTRGSSALEDWPDSIATLTVQDKQRYLSALGRDVDLEEDRLDYDERTRRMTLAGVGGRTEAGLTTAYAAILTLLQEQPGISGRAIEDSLGHLVRSHVRQALKSLVELNQVRTEPGERRAVLYSLASSAPVRQSAPRTDQASSAPPPIGGALAHSTSTPGSGDVG